MTYKEYREAIKELISPDDLEKLIDQIADDENITDLQYENLRRLIIKKIYA